MRRPLARVLSSVVHLHAGVTIAGAFSTRSANAALLSGLRTIQAELLVSIGRVPGTAMREFPER